MPAIDNKLPLTPMNAAQAPVAQPATAPAEATPPVDLQPADSFTPGAAAPTAGTSAVPQQDAFIPNAGELNTTSASDIAAPQNLDLYAPQANAMGATDPASALSQLALPNAPLAGTPQPDATLAGFPTTDQSAEKKSLAKPLALGAGALAAIGGGIMWFRRDKGDKDTPAPENKPETPETPIASSEASTSHTASMPENLPELGNVAHNGTGPAAGTPHTFGGGHGTPQVTRITLRPQIQDAIIPRISHRETHFERAIDTIKHRFGGERADVIAHIQEFIDNRNLNGLIDAADRTNGKQLKRVAKNAAHELSCFLKNIGLEAGHVKWLVRL